MRKFCLMTVALFVTGLAGCGGGARDSIPTTIGPPAKTKPQGDIRQSRTTAPKAARE
jgi:hypothetical protein